MFYSDPADVSGGQNVVIFIQKALKEWFEKTLKRNKMKEKYQKKKQKERKISKKKQKERKVSKKK